MEGTLRVRVLGGFAVDGIDEQALGSRKGRTMLKALVLARGQPISVDRLADVVWGDRLPAAPAEQVSVLVSRLRRVLGPGRVLRSDAGYSVLVDWLDVDELADRVGDATAALDAGRLAAARATADAGVLLARGELLAGEDAPWVHAERTRARALIGHARRVLAEAALHAGDIAAAAAAAEAALADDGYDESALRVLMRAHAAAGRPAAALAAYVRVRERVADDLGVPLASETIALHDEIVRSDDAADVVLPRVERPAVPGRTVALEALDTALARCRDSGRARPMLIVGEAGIGKTTLLDAWLASARQRAVVLTGRARWRGRDLPLQPVLDALGEHLRVIDPERRDELLGADAGLLGAVLGLQSRADDAATSSAVGDAEVGRIRLFAALRAVVERLARHASVVLAVDDLHLAGPATVAWLEHAAELRAPVLLIGATRHAVDADLPGRDVLSLGPLDLDAVTAVVGKERAADLHARSGGHPLLLAAIAGQGDGATTLADAVARRLEAIGPAASTLRAAAVVGHEVDVDLLADVLRAPAATFLADLEAAAGAGLLVEEGPGFVFRHELERQEIERAASGARRALVHREVAHALAGRPQPNPLAVAVHAHLGGDTALSATWYRRAADVAAARFDVGSADELLTAALGMLGDAGHPDRARLLAARARVRMAARRFDEAALDAAAAVAADPIAPHFETAGWVAYYRRRYGEALTAAREGLRVADDPATRASCLALAGRVRHGSGDLAAAGDHLDAAIAESTTSADPLARVWRAEVRLHQGRPADALADVTPDALADRPHDHPFVGLRGNFARAVALGHLGRPVEALACCDGLDRAIARAGEVGDRLRAASRNTRGWLLRWVGDGATADECNEEAVAHATRIGFDEGRYVGLLDRADGRLLVGDVDGAGRLVERLAAIESWSGSMAWHQRHRYGLLRARLDVVVGHAADGAERAHVVAADAAERGARRYELLARAVLAAARGPAAVDDAELDELTDGLARCAGLDGWWALASLAAALERPALAAVAATHAARVVRAAPHRDAAARLVAGVLD